MQRIEIIEFPFSFVDDLDLIRAEPQRYKLRDNNLKQKFGTKLYGQEMFNLLLEAFDQVVEYPFQMKIAKNRFFELLDEELDDWLKAYFVKEEDTVGGKKTAIFLKDVHRNFKAFSGTKMLWGAGFVNAVIRFFGKKADGNNYGYYRSHNDHMLSGYVYKDVAVVAAVTATSVTEDEGTDM